jgi:spore germination cell wall hydrolase CwlJ-like protein
MNDGFSMADLHDLSDEALLTTCLWAEARGEPENGQQTVCNVIFNRVKKRTARSIRDVILRPKLFSWTDPADVNFNKVFTAKNDTPESWARATKIAQMALANTLEDLSKNADHYLNVELAKKLRGGILPKWPK